MTVQAKDANGNNLTASGGTVTLSTDLGSLSGVTDIGNGTYSATYTAGTATGLSTITGTINTVAITDDATVTLTPGAASAAQTTITTGTTSLVANGSATTTVTVQAKDANGNNLTASGGTVTLSTDLGSLGSVTNNNNGTYTATLTSSSTAGTATVSGTIGGNAITDTATVSFTTAALDHFDIATITDRTAGVGFTVTVTAKDASNNTITDYSGSPTLTGNLSGTSTGCSGACTPSYGSFSFTNGVGIAAVTAYKAESARTVTVTDGSVDDTSNTFAVAPASAATASVNTERISPNGDGKLESLLVKGTFSEETDWQLTVFSGQVPARVTVSPEDAENALMILEGEDALSMAGRWKGTDLTSRLVADGDYFWRLTGVDASGNEISPLVGPVEVDCTAPVIRNLWVTPTFSPKRGSAKVSFSATEAARVRVRIVRKGSGRSVLGVSLNLDAGGGVTIKWDGRNRNRKMVKRGVYKVVIRAADRASNVTVNRAGTVRVVR